MKLKTKDRIFNILMKLWWGLLIVPISAIGYSSLQLWHSMLLSVLVVFVVVGLGVVYGWALASAWGFTDL